MFIQKIYVEKYLLCNIHKKNYKAFILNFIIAIGRTLNNYLSILGRMLYKGMLLNHITWGGGGGLSL